MQTGYSGINTFYSGLQYDGGFVEWYYIPKEKIAVWPSLKNNQELDAEPQLVGGATWYGPVKVPQSTVGFIETQERSSAGPFYKIAVEGIQPGEGRENRIILENMPYYEFIVVGKLRAGGFWVMIGNKESGLQFDHKSDNGKGFFNAAKNEFSFIGEAIHKALILPSFILQPSTPSPDAPDVDPGGGGSGDTTTNSTETIEFNNTDSVVIPWTNERKASFGIFPLIQVWFDDGLKFSIANVPIICDQAPPLTTSFTIDLTGVGSGFIQIK
jgi:hypothetical protein